MFLRWATAITLIIIAFIFEAQVFMIGVEQGIGFIPKSWSTIWWCVFGISIIGLFANYLIAWILADA